MRNTSRQIRQQRALLLTEKSWLAAQTLPSWPRITASFTWFGLGINIMVEKRVLTKIIVRRSDHDGDEEGVDCLLQMMVPHDHPSYNGDEDEGMR